MERLICALRRAGALADVILADAWRASRRWPPGVLVPPGARAQTGLAESVQTECLLLPAVGATLAVRLRWRQLCGVGPAGADAPPSPSSVASLRTVPRRVDVVLPVADLDDRVRRFPFSAAGGGPPRRAGVGWPTTGAAAVSGALEVSAHRPADARGALRLRVEVHNDVEWRAYDAPPARALRRSLIGVHVLLAVSAGRFLSIMDPPGWARAATADCVNSGAWPVLAGDARTLLAAPVPLTDHPAPSPEHPVVATAPGR